MESNNTKIVCPHCGSHNCFHEELEDGMTSYLCMGCGYTSNDLFKTGTDDQCLCFPNNLEKKQ